MAIAEAKIYSALTGSTLITKTSSNRIYPINLPQEVKYPAISYERVGSEPVNSFAGYSTYTNLTIQIDVWTTSYLASKTLASNIHKVMDSATAFSSLLEIENEDAEEDSRTNKTVFRISRDFSVWNQE